MRIGDSFDSDKKIYIHQSVYKAIHRFTANKTKNESGGFLVGSFIEEFGKTHIIISAFIEAKHCEATPTTLKFTHETWEYCHSQIKRNHRNKKILGWIHTHPDFGIFLSEYDRFIHDNFFKEDYNVAYVIDPIQKDEGFFLWKDGELVQSKGFYLFDEQGKEIKTKNEPSVVYKSNNSIVSWIQMFMITLLLIVAIIAGLRISDLENEIDVLQSQQETIVSTANQSLANLQQQIILLQEQLYSINNQNIDDQEASTIPEDENLPVD